jgi:hypothetical protein
MTLLNGFYGAGKYKIGQHTIFKTVVNKQDVNIYPVLFVYTG